MNIAEYREQVKSEIFNIDYVIINGCNLNCAGCRMKAPLFSSKGEISLSDVQNDIKELKRIGFNYNNSVITLFGGEPTFHSKLFDIIDLFINADLKLSILSNGYNFTKFKPSEFKKLSKVPITFSKNLLTDINWKNVEIVCKCYKIPYSYMLSSNEDSINKTKLILSKYSKNGLYDRQTQYQKCQSIFPIIDNHKVFICDSICHLDVINQKFKTNFISEYRELSSFNSIDEIKDYSLMIPEFCKYCGSDNPTTSEMICWRKSKCKKSEWF